MFVLGPMNPLADCAKPSILNRPSGVAVGKITGRLFWLRASMEIEASLPVLSFNPLTGSIPSRIRPG